MPTDKLPHNFPKRKLPLQLLPLVKLGYGVEDILVMTGRCKTSLIASYRREHAAGNISDQMFMVAKSYLLSGFRL